MIDLKHCTFLIPTLIDSSVRLENLLLVIKFLISHLNTNIFIGEQKNLNRVVEEYIKGNPSVKYFPIDCGNDLYFNRQSIFNQLAKMTTTKCIVLYDTDVVLFPRQYYTACKQIMEDIYDMVYPYDGNFLDVPEFYRKIISDTLDLKNIKLSDCTCLTKISEGGAVIFNRDVFIAGGMENENFKGWGWEDNERSWRYRELGYRQCRVGAPIYHFHHGRGASSKFYIDNSGHNNQQYFLKLKELSKEQLQEEIKTWSWCKDAK